jgi:predicted DNA-binding transcriptional regulator YafY
MRASRLVALLLHLQHRGGATAAELAAALEVSVRTVYRDVAALQAAGVPLWTETGPGGGIRLVEGWQSRLDGLTADEAGVLFLAGAPGAAADLGVDTVLAAAQVKVLATLPPELRGRAARVRERFHLDAPGWFHHDEPLPHLATVAEAVWAERRVDVRYQRSDRAVDRRLEPLGLVLKAGTWYLVARHHDQVRTYRVGRIVDAVTCSERFERPPGFDLAAWWASSSADFDRSMLRTHVRLRLAPRAAWALPRCVDQTAAREALAAAGPPDADGWVEIELAVEGEDVALGQLLALVPDVEVLEPATLRAALADVGARLAARHAPRPPARATPRRRRGVGGAGAARGARGGGAPTR